MGDMARSLLPLALVVGLTTALGAQVHTVQGLVKDQDARPVEGAEVMVEGRKRSARTDVLGRFLLDSVPGGKHRLLVRRVGYLAVKPRITVPQAPGDTLRITILAFVQQLEPISVEIARSGIYGVVGDSGYHALPGTLVEVLGARRHVYTDSTGRFAFEDLKQRQYMLRVSRVGYLARLIPVDLTKRGVEYSIFLHEYRPGMQDWANSNLAAGALEDLGIRLATELRRYRMTRAELERFGSLSLCDVPFVRALSRTKRDQEPNIVLHGSNWVKHGSLCDWSVDQIDLLEWGADPCRELWKSIATVMGLDCSVNPGRIISLYGTPAAARGPYVVIWPRG